MRTLLAISALLVPVALIACGSSTNSGGGGTGTGGNTGGSTGTTSTTTSTTSSTTSTTSTSSSTSSVDCTTACIAAHQKGALEFQGFVFMECAGCGSDAGTQPCISQCTAECADPTKFATTTPCGQCIVAEEGKGLGSACLAKAATGDCKSTDCVAFLTCATQCP